MVTQIPMRAYRSASRKMEDIRVNACERRDIRDAKSQIADIRRERMSVSSSIRDTVANTQDWTRGMGVSPSGQFRVIEEPRERKRMVSRQGIRGDAAKAVLILMTAVMIFAFLLDLAQIGSSDRQIRKLENRIASVTEKNGKLENELSLCTGDVSVCTEAVRLNLVSSGGMKTVKLTVPDNANMTLNNVSGEGNAELEADRVASILIN